MKLVKDPDEHEAPPRNVIRLPVVTSLDLEPDVILQAAKGQLECVIVIGYEKGEDGDEYFASSIADGGTAAWLLQRALLKLLQSVDNSEK